MTAEAEEEGEHGEGDDGGVEVAGAGDLPEEKGAPGVEEDLLAGAAEVAEDLDEGPESEAFAEEEDGLHAGDGGGDVGDDEEEELGEGGVDGAGVVGPVDHGVDVAFGSSAEEGEGGVCGDVAVGVDAGVLDDPVPDVAVDVGGEDGVGVEEGEAAGDGDGKDEGKGEAVGGSEEHEEAGEDVAPDRPAGSAGEADGEGFVLGGEVAGEEEKERAEEGQGEVGLPRAGVGPVGGLRGDGGGHAVGLWAATGRSPVR